MKTAFLALGSNLGDRLAYLAAALSRLQVNDVVQVVRLSSVYETAPIGLVDQPDFFNMVAEIRTRLAPETLLSHALGIEARLGRLRRERWGPRIIDIDLLWFEGATVTTPELTLPHPRLAERGFVMVPLAEIAPNLVVDGQTCGQRATGFNETAMKKIGPLDGTNSLGAVDR